MLRKIALALGLALILAIFALAGVSADGALAGGAVEYGLMWDW